MQRLVFSIFLCAGVLLLAGCRGTTSRNPPIHLNLNMDFQQKYQPQEPSWFFADNRSMRPPVPGTVARGLLREDTRLYLGRTQEGGFVEEIPIPLTREVLERGQERYDIYCTVCHGQTGSGLGIIMVGIAGEGYGYTPAPSYHEPRLREVSAGYLYDVIANGVRSMPPYGAQIPVADRWAIVAYIRALQRSRLATIEDVPPELRGELPQIPDVEEEVVGPDTADVELTE